MGPIASVFGYIMDFLFRITSSMGIMNIGLCIILFTIITKLLLFPLTIKQQESSKLMSLMNPEIKAVQNRYKGKTDQASMAKQQVEMQAVYEKYGSNPMAGCLPMAIQLPIIFALYRVIYNIPAYVPSVRVFFDNVANPLMGQPDYINKISELASGVGMAVDKVDYTVANKVVDMLYKLTPAGWDTLESLFPQISSTIAENASKIEQMNYFFGINLATPPFTGFNHITIAWIIPILAGLTQWISTKLISNLQQVDQDAPGASMMNSMMITMPLMSVFFCFTFSTGLGIYWVAGSVIRCIIQLIVNKQMDKVDIDTLVKENMEKYNAKREKQGLPPERISNQAKANLKNIKNPVVEDENAIRTKSEKRLADIKASTEYYNKTAKPGSIASRGLLDTSKSVLLHNMARVLYAVTC